MWNNIIFQNIIWFTIDFRTLVTCAGLCLQNNNCQYFAINKITSTCFSVSNKCIIEQPLITSITSCSDPTGCYHENQGNMCYVSLEKSGIRLYFSANGTANGLT